MLASFTALLAAPNIPYCCINHLKLVFFAPMPTHLVSNYSEMGIHMLENILPTRCMALVSIVLQMGIGMREPGMRVEGKAWECTHSEMGRLSLVTGKMEFLMSQARRTPLILYLLLLFIIPKCSMQCR